MRFTSFLAGAVVGAAAMTYMNRNNKTIMMGFSQLGDNMNKFMDKAMLSFADKNMPTRKEQDTSSTEPSMSKVEELASMDPQVKNEVDQILSQNGVSAH